MLAKWVTPGELVCSVFSVAWSQFTVTRCCIILKAKVNGSVSFRGDGLRGETGKIMATKTGSSEFN